MLRGPINNRHVPGSNLGWKGEQPCKLRRACVASVMVVGFEFLEVEWPRESTKMVEANDKGRASGKESEREGEKHPCARGEARNGGSRKREKETKENDEGEGKEERAIEGKSRATCTRQQPSEELIINLLSPSPNAAVPTRPPSLHFHLRLSLSSATLSSLSLVLPPLLPFPFFPISPSLPPLFSLLLTSPLPSILSSPSPTLRRGVFTITITRTLAFAAFPSRSRLRFPPPSYRPLNLVATFGLPNARGMRRPASRRLKSRISFRPTMMMHGRGRKRVRYLRRYYFFQGCRARNCVISRDSRYPRQPSFSSSRSRVRSLSSEVARSMMYENEV